MNWFDTSGLTNLAKTALKEAQKTIDKALDIQDDSGENQEPNLPEESAEKPTSSTANTPQDSSDFFSSWGLTVSAESAQDDAGTGASVVTESPSKASAQTNLWGSFAGSFFEQSKSSKQTVSDATIVRPPKAKSLNVISNLGSFGSQDDLFSKSQLVMTDGAEIFELNQDNKEGSGQKVDERRSSSRSAGLSLLSSRNSSDSVEVLSQSLKTTPDSEPASLHSISHSSSVGHKLNSESVEILPDSLLSPSSIECLGFDSYSSDKNSSSSSNLTPEGDGSDKKSTPIGDRTAKACETADSVSLVADDDEDTISYNSVSECTAPTVLDNDDKIVGQISKATLRPEPQKKFDKELMIQLDQPLPQKVQISENSSNDGSWSDRTLNADNDSLTLDPNTEEQKKEVDHEDVLIEKLSDSSSFYNVTSEMLRSESSAFVNVEKQQCHPDSSESSLKDGSIKERTSPVSSDSKSDLVKIGSDRTSGHTSGDELETTTSSDIEIIPSPNGDNGHGFCRSSPAKYAFKQSKCEGSTSPNVVDLVLGKALATKIRGHNRELSEASITSDDSQSENEMLMRRLCEMTEVLENRESRLVEVSRSHAQLAEANLELRTRLEARGGGGGREGGGGGPEGGGGGPEGGGGGSDGGDVAAVTEEYTQRLSALEKKFQQAIRDKDLLRKQLESSKAEALACRGAELEALLRERDDMIAALQSEGETLSRQQLQLNNIIKKLRQREKDAEQLVKARGDRISELTAELDRLRRAMSAKEEMEVTQIEAVYRLTAANKKHEAELAEAKSALDDATQRLETTSTSLLAARRELAETQRSAGDVAKAASERETAVQARDAAEREADRLRAQLQQLQAEMQQEEKRWHARTEALRHELSDARLQAPEPCREEAGAAALLSQLAALQRAALDRDTAHARALQQAHHQRAEAEALLAAASTREQAARAECGALGEHARDALAMLDAARAQAAALTEQRRAQLERAAGRDRELESKTQELSSLQEHHAKEVEELRRQLDEARRMLAEHQASLDTERRRNVILQEQLSARGTPSPPQSLLSEPPPLWEDEGGPAGGGALSAALCALAGSRGGQLRAQADQMDRLLRERRALLDRLAGLQARVDDCQSVQEQYDALLQMYGEKEEQLNELRLDLQDVTRLYKAQLDDLVALRTQRQ